MSDKKQQPDTQPSNNNKESKLRLEKVYIPPELKEYGDLTTLTAGGSGNAVESAMGNPAKKRP